jgi:hypothetical protein
LEYFNSKEKKMTRKVNGKYYFLVDRGFNKLKAKSKANELRKKGFNVRIFSDSNGYSVFRRHKSH